MSVMRRRAWRYLIGGAALGFVLAVLGASKRRHGVDGVDLLLGVAFGGLAGLVQAFTADWKDQSKRGFWMSWLVTGLIIFSAGMIVQCLFFSCTLFDFVAMSVLTFVVVLIIGLADRTFRSRPEIKD